MADKNKLNPEEMSCATCGIRHRAETHPGSFWSKLWVWHTGWCPRWKVYQEALAETGKENDQVAANV